MCIIDSLDSSKDGSLPISDILEKTKTWFDRAKVEELPSVYEETIKNRDEFDDTT